ncbi:MAG TPA: hypothetical protein VFY04_06680 [Solirubrobacterales bacterium]|nr:hypothetical protein [Solirubrobacterales bacterium]
MKHSRAIAPFLVAMLAVAAVAHGADEPTRETYLATVEPICKGDREATERILADTKDAIREGRLDAAGRQLIRASRSFNGTIRRLVAVPRPAADDAKLQKWFKFLRILRDRIRQTGVYYKEGKKLRATHESIAAERTGNAANNVSFSLGFRYCRLSRSRLG